MNQLECVKGNGVDGRRDLQGLFRQWLYFGGLFWFEGFVCLFSPKA